MRDDADSDDECYKSETKAAAAFEALGKDAILEQTEVKAPYGDGTNLAWGVVREGEVFQPSRKGCSDKDSTR